MGNVPGSHVDLYVGIVLLDGPHAPVVCSWGVEHHHRARGLGGPDAVQDRGRPAIPKIHWHLHVPALGNPVAPDVQRGEGDELLAEELADHLADAAEAGDDDVAPQVIDLALRRLQLQHILVLVHVVQSVAQGAKHRREGHAERYHEVHLAAKRAGEDGLGGGVSEEDEGELAPGRKHEAGPNGCDAAEAKDGAGDGNHGGLPDQEDGHGGKDGAPLLHQERHGELHPDGHEEEAKQQPLVGRDVALDLQGVFRLREE
mmetsp:Transcript_9933/g.30226  ORF Transcript_9933/g.30226 Transcript_9933/m.30226 type:complete len:258 (+) Transcript_9933:289-1062(+)